MPRGGPDASWLDRKLQTDRLEYLDRDDADGKKRAVVRSLDRMGRVFGLHESFARVAFDQIRDVPDAKVLELGSAHGGLSRRLLKLHPSAHITVTDVEPGSVAAIAEGELGVHPRVTVRAMDATAIDAPDGSYDLAVFAQSFHHLPPLLASRVFAEGTRVADKLVIIDLPRPPSLLHILQLSQMLPLAAMIPLLHDGAISSLRAYSRSALLALARHADPAIHVELRGGGLLNSPIYPRPQIVVATRRLRRGR
jgi:ubiquinone/menaquinone biosynthesis C-methylase UbiE